MSFDAWGLMHAAVGHPEGNPLDLHELSGGEGSAPRRISQAKVDELIFNEAQNEVIFAKYLD